MNRQSKRGFALLIIMMLVALLAIGGMSLLKMINLDITMVATDRKYQAARETAEGGIMEMINDTQTPKLMPGLSDPDLSTAYQPSGHSPFSDSALGTHYEARFDLVRVVPLSESSHTLSRAIVHELNVTGHYKNDAASEIQTEVYRTVAFRSGLVLPRRHAR